MVLYGDSILHGAYVADGNRSARHLRYPAAEIKAQRPAYVVDDRTVSGTTLKQAEWIFYETQRSSRIAVLASGIAEGWGGAEVAPGLRRLVAAVRKEGRIPVITGYARQLPNALMTADKLAGRDRIDAEARAVAVELGVEFADFGAAGPVEIADDVHPAQAYSLQLSAQLVAALDRVAPECKP